MKTCKQLRVYSDNILANFSLDIVIKYILFKKECMKMTEMFIVSSRSRRLLLLSGFEPADFGPIEGVLGGHAFFFSVPYIA